MSSTHVLEHGTSRPGRWLRSHRFRLTVWIAVLEGLLVVVHVLPKWPIFLVGVVAIAFWWFLGRSSRSDLVRQTTWVFAASQALVMLVPIVLIIATTVAIAVLAILAVVALIFLFTERP